MSASSFELLSPLLSALLISLPMVVVWIVGIALALQYHATQPRSVHLALLGFVVLIVQTLIFVPLGSILPLFLIQGEPT